MSKSVCVPINTYPLAIVGTENLVAEPGTSAVPHWPLLYSSAMLDALKACRTAAAPPVAEPSLSTAHTMPLLVPLDETDGVVP